MTFQTTPGLLARAQKLTLLALQLGRVERATRHPDGVRPETEMDASEAAWPEEVPDAR